MLHNRRTGFTLIEAIVAISVIVLLLAVIVPAIQHARESARRTQSKNHLKQLGLALHNFESTASHFPSGGIFEDNGTSDYGWVAAIAPYMIDSPWYFQMRQIGKRVCISKVIFQAAAVWFQ